MSIMVLSVIFAGLAFDFVNGFHDASNSISTIVATRVLSPKQAVLWAAFFNIIAAFFFGTGVAKTVGSGLVSLDAVTPMVVLCGLLGATLWGLVTWRFGLPSSSSHALLGGYAGSAMANSAIHGGWSALGSPILVSGWIKVLAFIVVAPCVGVALGIFLMTALSWISQRGLFSLNDTFFRRGQLLSSAFLSMMHGGNDAQKTAGIITGALVASGTLASFDIPTWVLVVSYGTMGLGTLVGGWRIVRTMGHRLTKLTPSSGVCAESAAALSILGATMFNLPVSTTHVVTGSILGVGTASESGKVHWHIGRRIAWAWLFTIPAAATVGGLFMVLSLALGG